MKLVGARLHRYVHDGVACLPILRGVVAGLNGPFLNRIRSRLVLLRGALSQTVGCIHAFNQEDFRVVHTAIDAHRWSGSSLYQGRARHQRDHGVRIPDASAARDGSRLQERKAIHAFCRDDVA